MYEECQYLRRAYLKLGYIYTAACTSVPRIELAENVTFQALRDSFRFAHHPLTSPGAMKRYLRRSEKSATIRRFPAMGCGENSIQAIQVPQNKMKVEPSEFDVPRLLGVVNDRLTEGCGASCGRLCPMPPLMRWYPYLPENFARYAESRGCGAPFASPSRGSSAQ